MSDTFGYAYRSEEEGCYEGTTVPENKLGIKDAAELRTAADAAIAERTAEMLEVGGIAGHYNLDHLRSFHRTLFQDIFSWAGEIRTVDMDSEVFCKASDIKERSVQIFLRLENEDYLKGLPVDEMAERLAYYTYEIESLHPFRYGSFDAMNAFFTQMCQRVGFKLDYASASEDELDAMRKASVEGDSKPAETLYGRILTKIPRKK